MAIKEIQSSIPKCVISDRYDGYFPAIGLFSLFFLAPIPLVDNFYEGFFSAFKALA